MWTSVLLWLAGVKWCLTELYRTIRIRRVIGMTAAEAEAFVKSKGYTAFIGDGQAYRARTTDFNQDRVALDVDKAGRVETIVGWS